MYNIQCTHTDTHIYIYINIWLYALHAHISMLYIVVLTSITSPDSSDPAQDTLQMKERCDALKSAHEAVIERGQAEELQMQHDEQAAQAGAIRGREHNQIISDIIR